MQMQFNPAKRSSARKEKKLIYCREIFSSCIGSDVKERPASQRDISLFFPCSSVINIEKTESLCDDDDVWLSRTME